MTDETATLVARMNADALHSMRLGTGTYVSLRSSAVIALIAAYEAEKERADYERKRADVSGEYLKAEQRYLRQSKAQRDDLAELLRRSVVVIDSLAGTLEGMEPGVTCVGARRLLADIKALLARANPPNLMRDADKAHKK